MLLLFGFVRGRGDGVGVGAVAAVIKWIVVRGVDVAGGEGGGGDGVVIDSGVVVFWFGV